VPQLHAMIMHGSGWLSASRAAIASGAAMGDALATMAASGRFSVRINSVKMRKKLTTNKSEEREEFELHFYRVGLSWKIE
jgi:hypothetical protein